MYKLWERHVLWSSWANGCSYESLHGATGYTPTHTKPSPVPTRGNWLHVDTYDVSSVSTRRNCWHTDTYDAIVSVYTGQLPSRRHIRWHRQSTRGNCCHADTYDAIVSVYTGQLPARRHTMPSSVSTRGNCQHTGTYDAIVWIVSTKNKIDTKCWIISQKK